jgi:DNA-binding beta-propeller fold protein YncE
MDLSLGASRIRLVRSRVLFAVAFAGAVGVSLSGMGMTSARSQRPVERHHAMPRARPAAPVRPVLDGAIRLRAGVVDVAAANGAVWVLGCRAVTRISAESDRVVATVRVPGDACVCGGEVAAAAGSVWVAAGSVGGVYRINPVSDRVVARVHIPWVARGVGLGGGRVWVTVIPRSGPGELVQIDPRTDQLVGPPVKVGPGPGQVVYWHGGVWVADTSPFSVMHVDPATRRVTTVVGSSPVQPGDFAVGAIGLGDGSLWVASGDSLARIDPKSYEVTASFSVPRADLIGFGAGEVWVMADPKSRSPTLYYPIKGTAALWQIDPRTKKVVGKPLSLDLLQPVAIAAGARKVWVGDYNAKTVTHLRLAAGSP